MSKRAADSQPDDEPASKELRAAHRMVVEPRAPPPTLEEIEAAGRVIDRAFEAALDAFEQKAKPVHFESDDMGDFTREHYQYRGSDWFESREYIRINEALRDFPWWYQICAGFSSSLVGDRMAGQTTDNGNRACRIALWRDVYPPPPVAPTDTDT